MVPCLKINIASQLRLRKILPVVFLFSCTILLACAESFQGIRMRAQSPSIAEASRRISLALRADGYTLLETNVLGLYHLTDWKVLAEKEKAEAEQDEPVEAMMEVKLQQRGALYDIFVDITLRSGERKKPDALHPLVQKWQKILDDLVEEEFREEG